MNELVLESESLNHILDGRDASADESHEIFESAQADPRELFRAAQALRTKNKGNIVTFSKKSFFNLINLCRDTCSYCTYKAEPGQEKLSLMSKQGVAGLLDLAKKYHCVEALFVTGESPEQKYPEARKWLQENGFADTIEYIIHCSQMALDCGLFPHTNAGNLSKKQMRELQKTNMSLGLMLESSSERLMQKGMPHYQAASKTPRVRLEVLENAGHLGIPMTTGILTGIGENRREVVESIMAIKNIHDRYGNIQEVILQNFQPKQDTAMRNSPAADQDYFKTIVAMTRIAMPQMNIQIPPNLSPVSYRDFLNTGINDWGGISPLTPDHVNPEFPWPKISDIDADCKGAGFDLKCRFPAYPEFLALVDDDLRDRILVISDDAGYVRDEYWRP